MVSTTVVGGEGGAVRVGGTGEQLAGGEVLVVMLVVLLLLLFLLLLLLLPVQSGSTDQWTPPSGCGV